MIRRSFQMETSSVGRMSEQRPLWRLSLAGEALIGKDDG